MQSESERIELYKLKEQKAREMLLQSQEFIKQLQELEHKTKIESINNYRIRMIAEEEVEKRNKKNSELEVDILSFSPFSLIHRNHTTFLQYKAPKSEKSCLLIAFGSQV